MTAGRSSESLLDLSKLVLKSVADLSPDLMEKQPIVSMILIHLPKSTFQPFILIPQHLIPLHQFPHLTFSITQHLALIILLTGRTISPMLSFRVSSPSQFEFCMDIFLIRTSDGTMIMMIYLDYLIFLLQLMHIVLILIIDLQEVVF